MVEHCVYYGEHGERCIVNYDDPSRYKQKLPPGAKWDYPDEVQLIGIPLIKREKTSDELTKRDWDRWGPTYIRYAAKDIPLSQAMPDD